MTSRRRMFMNTIPKEYYVFNGDVPPDGKCNFVHYTKWNTIGSSTSITTPVITTYNGKSCLKVQTRDNSSTNVVGVSLVETSGIKGSILKHYSSIKIEIASVFGVWALGGQNICLHDSIDGSDYTSNRVTYVGIPQYSGTRNYTIYELPLTGITLNDDTLYYISYRHQTSKAATSITQYSYISKVWLE